MDPKGTLDALDVVDLERLFPEEDFPYTSDFAIPFMSVNSISDGYYEEEQEEEVVEAEHRGYNTGWRAKAKLICKPGTYGIEDGFALSARLRKLAF